MTSLKPVSAKITTIIHATEDPNKVAEAIRNILSPDASTLTIVSATKGHYGNQIKTMSCAIKNARMVERLFQELWKGLSLLERTEVYSSLASRVDTGGTLFLRVDKQEAMKGRIRLQDSDPIKIGISFRAAHVRHVERLNDLRKTLDEIQ